MIKLELILTCVEYNLCAVNLMESIHLKHQNSLSILQVFVANKV